MDQRRLVGEHMDQYVKVIHDTFFSGDTCEACIVLHAAMTVLIGLREVRLCLACAEDLAEKLLVD